jgi:hypothetical protein
LIKRNKRNKVTDLIEAADAHRWNHLEMDMCKHQNDWQPFGVELTVKEYQELPKLLAQHPHCELYAYQHDTRFAWGYYRRQLNVGKRKLYDQTFSFPKRKSLIKKKRRGNFNVLAVYNPKAMEIIHVMCADVRYFEKKAKLMKAEKSKRIR